MFYKHIYFPRRIGVEMVEEPKCYRFGNHESIDDKLMNSLLGGGRGRAIIQKFERGVLRIPTGADRILKQYDEDQKGVSRPVG